MTVPDIVCHYQAYCCLEHRHIHAGIAMPQSMNPIDCMRILNPELFTSTALTRLTDGAPRLSAIAHRMLWALAKTLDNHAD